MVASSISAGPISCRMVISMFLSFLWLFRKRNGKFLLRTFPGLLNILRRDTASLDTPPPLPILQSAASHELDPPPSPPPLFPAPTPQCTSPSFLARFFHSIFLSFRLFAMGAGKRLHHHRRRSHHLFLSPVKIRMLKKSPPPSFQVQEEEHLAGAA